MQWRSILAVFLPVASVIAAAVYWFAPRVFLNLPRRQPLGWGLVMLLYPLLSVVPQTLVYRAFIFARYRLLFPSVGAMLLASAASFSWVHIVLRNPVAPILTLPAGVLFAWRYKRTGSVMVSALEHALYGCLIFTIGLGGYFYTGAVR
jgi:membrane protease YdiL (CAAX protease family)